VISNFLEKIYGSLLSYSKDSLEFVTLYDVVKHFSKIWETQA